MARRTKSSTKIRRIKPKKQLPYQREIIATVIVGVILFVTLAVATFNPADNTFLRYVDGASAIMNKAGPLGANSADLLLQLFGSAIYLLLFSILLIVLRKAFVMHDVYDTEKQRTRYVMATLSLVLAGSTGLCSLLAFDITHSIPGGLFGTALATMLVPVVGQYGGILVCSALLLVGFLYLVQVPVCSHLLRSVFYALYVGVQGAGWFVRHGIKQSIRFLLVLPTMMIKTLAYVFRHHEQLPVHMQKDIPKKNTSRVVPSRVAHESGMRSAPLVAADSSFVLPELKIFACKKTNFVDTQQEKALNERGKKLEEKLHHFGVKGDVVGISPGPVITMFEYQPSIKSKLSKITALEGDLAMALQAISIRTIAPIPGKNAVGFEIANKKRHDVFYGNILADDAFTKFSGQLPLVLGVDVVGQPVVADLLTMPHLLIGGTTGSGKSVGLNAMLASLLCARTPDDLRVVLIDPKRLEFTPYTDIPHLLFPIVTDPRRVPGVLKWVVFEMERRYEAMAQAGVRNISEFREIEKIPYIVVVIDELADLMMVAGKEIEIQIVRIAQMARAAGIHMMVATQRPSVDVVTGLIKVNFPSRIAFRVSSKIDSRTILDQAGAEKLLGRGDMLYIHGSSSHAERVHGAYLSAKEIEKLTNHWREQGDPAYEDLHEAIAEAEAHEQSNEPDDPLYPQVRTWLETVDELSISQLQRQYRIGFNRSARLIQQLERDGLLAPAQGSKPRKVLR